MQVFLSLFLGLLPVALFIAAFFVPIEYADYLLFAAPVFLTVAIIYETKTQQVKFHTIAFKKRHQSKEQINTEEAKINTVETLVETSSSVNIEASENDVVCDQEDDATDENIDLNKEELDLTPKNIEDTMFDPSDIEWDSDMRLKPRTKSI